MFVPTRISPSLQHLLQQILLFRRLLCCYVLVTHVTQLTRRVGFHGLATLALLSSSGEDAGFLDTTIFRYSLSKSTVIQE